MVAENTAGPYREALARAEEEEAPRRRWAVWRVMERPNGEYELQRRWWFWPFWVGVASRWSKEDLQREYNKLVAAKPRSKEIARW